MKYKKNKTFIEIKKYNNLKISKIKIRKTKKKSSSVDNVEFKFLNFN